MVRMVSSSAGEGPGAVISRGLTERRIFRRSMASGTGKSLWGRMMCGRITRHVEGHEPIDKHFGSIVMGPNPSHERDKAGRRTAFHRHKVCGGHAHQESPWSQFGTMQGFLL